MRSPRSRALDADTIERMATGLAAVRERGGRLFILGVGGGAGHASHAVNDFRKICEYRMLRADRQRLGADRAHQRRGLGRRLRELAAGLPPVATRRAVRLLRRWRLAEHGHQHEPRQRASIWRSERRAPTSSASSDGTAASRRSVADACVIVDRARAHARRTSRSSRRSSGTCSCRIRRSQRAGTWESDQDGPRSVSARRAWSSSIATA